MAAIRNPKDFWSGVIFVAIGLFAIVYGSKYTLGSAARMGPGYFPRILGILLILLGTILAVRALRLNGPPLPAVSAPPTRATRRRTVRASGPPPAGRSGPASG